MEVVAKTDSERLVVVETMLNDMHSDIHNLQSKVEGLSGRPSWAVVTIIQILSTACGALFAALVSILIIKV